MITNPKILLNKAAIFAVKVHAGQFRRDGVTPYVTHPLRVANLLSMQGAGDTEILCGLWHDILEDLPEKRSELVDELSSYNLPSYIEDETMRILEALNKPLDGNRKVRLTKFVEQIINGGESAILVKICDRIDNVMDSEGIGNFAQEYVVNETGYIVEKFSELDFNGRIDSAFCTLEKVRKEMMERNGWVENEI